MDKTPIPYNKPFWTGSELPSIQETVRHISSQGPFTQQCESWLEKFFVCDRALIVHSCTAALEMSAILIGVKPGDEIIMPSFTFSSTANSFVLRGGMPVFVDITPDTLNIDPVQVASAVTPFTKAIVPVHYAGVPCQMDALSEIAKSQGIYLIEDAAQSITSTYQGRLAGTFGDLSALSFHETKNIISGEGGALLINRPDLVGRAHVLRDKGTNRSEFLAGCADKYTWCDLGSSFGPSDILAAFLSAQLDRCVDIIESRRVAWNRYHALLEGYQYFELCIGYGGRMDCI